MQVRPAPRPGVALVCVDVDGTLVGSSGRVPAEVWPAAARLRAAGVRLALCSGRAAFGDARAYAARLDADGWHVFQNGASVVCLGDGASRSAPLPAGAVDALRARAVATGRLLELYDDAGYAVEPPNDVAAGLARRHAGLLGVPYAPRPYGALAGAPVRALWVVPLADEAAVLAEPHPGLTLGASTSPSMPDVAFINVTAAGVDKARAVRAVADAYALPMARVMMVGDGLNDVSALEAVGVPVAMGNAEPAARAAARHVVAAVDAGGLAAAFALALDPSLTAAAA